MFDFKVAEMQVDYVDHLGGDINVVNAARVSFAKEVKEFDLEKDTKLINYLAKHNHFTPLAHTSVTIRVKGSCEVWNVFPKAMPEEEKQKAKQFIMDYIDLVRKYL